MKYAWTIMLTVLSALTFSGCKNYDYSGNPRVIITLTDATSDQFTSLTTSVKEVALYDGSSWFVSESVTTLFNIMSYTGDDYLTILDREVPEGHYTKIRVIFGDGNYLSVNGEGSTYDLVSSADDLIWEADIDYEATANKIVVGSVDLDVNKSVTYDELNDEYSFSPKNGCRILNAETEGAVSAVAVDTGGNVITSVVQVQFRQNDSILRSTYCSTENGKLFYRLSAGIYDVQFVPQNENLAEVTVDSVEVSNAELTSIGTVVFFKKDY